MKIISKKKRNEMKAFAQFLAVMGVRNNTKLEDLHSGVTPSSKVGDFSDVKVVTPYGEIKWNEISRISDEEMRLLMLSIERALEIALCTYGSFSKEERPKILKSIIPRRTYDVHDYSK